MLRQAVLATVLVGSAAILGCKEDQPATPPEVPKAGSAATPPGPAPDGQTEPGAAPAAEGAPAGGEAAPSDPPKTSAIEDSGVRVIAHEESADDKAVKVEILDWKETEALIASHKGKVVVLDMWSLSCEPCRREFPNLVKLHNTQAGKVACMSLSTDYAGIKSKPPKFYEPKVLEFLTEQKATFQNVLCSVDSETLFDQLALPSIPAVYVYDKEGKLAKRFDGEEVHYDTEVLPLVEQLLAK